MIVRVVPTTTIPINLEAQRLRVEWNSDECVAELDAIAKRGSHGVILKGPDVPSITAAVDRLAYIYRQRWAGPDNPAPDR